MRARDNPFRAERIDRLPFIPVGTSFEQLLSKLEQMDFVAAITGPEGSGKTTLLADLKRTLQEKGFVTKSIFVNDTTRFTRNERKKFVAGLKGGEIVLLDGTDRLATGMWRRFKRKVLNSARGLIITSHKAGRLETLVECATTERLFLEIVSKLTGGVFPIDERRLTDIYVRHNGNIRNCLMHLYDVCAKDGEFI
jgi:energy-coupling factor transporter ATP-binding protein EcfA2